MISGIIWASIAVAKDPPPRPDLTEEIEGMPDCPRALEFRPGEKWDPPAWLIDDEGIVRCRAIAEPYTSFADLLNVETEYERLRGLYRVDTSELQVQIDGWKWRAEWTEERLSQPLPITARPWFNQVIGAGVVLGTGWIVLWGDREIGS